MIYFKCQFEKVILKEKVQDSKATEKENLICMNRVAEIGNQVF